MDRVGSRSRADAFGAANASQESRQAQQAQQAQQAPGDQALFSRAASHLDAALGAARQVLHRQDSARHAIVSGIKLGMLAAAGNLLTHVKSWPPASPAVRDAADAASSPRASSPADKVRQLLTDPRRAVEREQAIKRLVEGKVSENLGFMQDFLTFSERPNVFDAARLKSTYLDKSNEDFDFLSVKAEDFTKDFGASGVNVPETMRKSFEAKYDAALAKIHGGDLSAIHELVASFSAIEAHVSHLIVQKLHL